MDRSFVNLILGRYERRPVHPESATLVSPPAFNDNRAVQCWIPGAETASVAVLGFKGCDIAIAMSVDVSHPGAFAFPVSFVVLNDTKRIDPDML
jgi:hypothetical protein